MRNWIIATFATALISVGTPLGAFSPAPQQEQSQAQSQQDEQSFTGCLAKGSGDGKFVLKTEQGNIMVYGSPDLAKHVGHTVTVTAKKGASGFEVTSVKEVAASCKE